MEFLLPDSLITKDPVETETKVEETKVEETKAEEPKVEEKKEVTEINLFGNLTGTDEPGETKEVEDPLTELAQAFGLALPENTAKWDKSSLKTSLQKHVDESKQKLDLSAYDPEIQLLHEYIQDHGGSLMGLMVDSTIKELNEYVLMDPEYAFRYEMATLLLGQGYSEEEVGPMIELRVSKIAEAERPKFFKDFHEDKIRKEINPKIEERIRVLNEDKKSYQTKIKATLDADKQNVVNSMIKTVEDLEAFVGLKVPQEQKDAIVKKIRGGNIEKEIAKNPGKYQMLGYLYETTNRAVVDIYKDVITKQTDSKYFEGVTTTLDQFYNKPRTKPGEDAPSGNVNDWSKLKKM